MITIDDGKILCSVGLGSRVHNAGLINNLPYHKEHSYDPIYGEKCDLPATHQAHIGSNEIVRVCPYHKLILDLIKNEAMHAPSNFGGNIQVHSIEPLDSSKASW